MFKTQAALAVWLAAIMGVIVAVTPGRAVADPDTRRPSGLFGSTEFPGQAPMQWFAALRQLRDDGRVFAACEAARDSCADSSVAGWESRMDAMRPLDPVAMLDAVNRAVNDFAYRSDAENYSEADRWSGPRQFLARSGDCEDYAIFKMFTLERLGFDPRSLRVVLVRDTRHNADHAVLAATHNGRNYILDNNEVRLLTDDAIAHYVPLVSFDRTGSWGHAVRSAGSQVARDPSPASGDRIVGRR